MRGPIKRLRTGRVGAGRGTHQLMEAAINNAGVVYHSDPRLILAYLASRPGGGSLCLTLLSPLISSSLLIQRYDASQSELPEDGRLCGSAALYLTLVVSSISFE